MAALDEITGKLTGIGNEVWDNFQTKLFEKYNVSDTTLGQDSYDFTYRAFPSDLGNEDSGHYMVININVPATRDGSVRGAFGSQFTFMQNEFSKVDTLRFGDTNAFPGSVQREAMSLPRNTRRIKESIALYMPSTGLMFNSQPIYEDISLTALAGGIIASGLSGVTSGLGGTAGAILQGVGGVILNNAGPMSRVVGMPINPRIEILYATTPQRAFIFEVLLAPRNKEESQIIDDIVRTLRFHSAPEIDPALSLTLIPPAEFDITFYVRGEENTAIPRINTCVLDRIEYDISPTGVYSTFSNGYPVASRLLLGFREIEMVHKLRIAQGF